VHILPRILAIHRGTDPFHYSDVSLNVELGNDALTDSPAKLTDVIFKSNIIYCHRLFRVNYTTYDLQRKSDAVNPHTDHRDVMLLSCSDGSSQHPFCYARVWGIFHANSIYTGPELRDYQSRCIKFLWVWWFEVLEDRPSGWQHLAFDTARFVPMVEDDAFGFVDPADVLQDCHIIPSFADGMLHPDGITTSLCARDSGDWKCYYVNRYELCVAGTRVHG
jgi:hypothetical protein